VVGLVDSLRVFERLDVPPTEVGDVVGEDTPESMILK
jgi:hypothetical protein